MGFASALAEIGLPGSEIVLGLFCFNLGIELAQIFLVGALAIGAAVLTSARSLRPIEVMWTRLTASRLPRRAVVYTVGTLAAYWFIERALMLA